MKNFLRIAAVLALVLCPALAAAQQGTAASAASPSQIQKSVEAFLRNLYALGPDVKLTVSAPAETAIPGLLKTVVEVTVEDNKQTADIFVSKDGKYLLRGEMADLSKDPLAENRAKLQTQGAPAVGSANPAVTVVEFSDFECPVCRNLHDGLRGLLPNYPQVRLIFKDFPIESIHPWARTAALAGHCAFQQNPQTFWKLYDLIYDNQDLISAENAYGKMLDYGERSGMTSDSMKACLASPEAASAVDSSLANGKLLEVGSTPTIFVNGRRLVGADIRTLEQYIQYELAKQKEPKAGDKK